MGVGVGVKVGVGVGAGVAVSVGLIGDVDAWSMTAGMAVGVLVAVVASIAMVLTLAGGAVLVVVGMDVETRAIGVGRLLSNWQA